MADENNKKNVNDENDPYNFFKFNGPSNNKNNNNRKNTPKKRFPFFTVLILVIIVSLISQFFFTGNKSGSEISFSEFKNKVASGVIVEVHIYEHSVVGYEKQTAAVTTDSKDTLPLFLAYESEQQKGKKWVASSYVYDDLLAFLDEHNVKYEFVISEKSPFLSYLLSLLVPIGIIALFYFLFFRKMGGGGG